MGDRGQSDPKKPAAPVVAIGASAGGLDALKSFFGAVTGDRDAAYVVITHRNAESVNLLPEILSRCTAMPVTEAQDGDVVEAGCIYVSPSAHFLRIEDGRLALHDVVRDQVPLPIDFFFRALAEDRNAEAICVLLSGTGSDGTSGLQAVKGNGGMAMVQDLRTAAFSDMPASAIATGLVDYVLPPDEMPAAIAQYVRGLAASRDKRSANNLIGRDALEEILGVIRRRTGSDFGSYKTNTMQRRVERRMNVHHLSDAWDYLRYLQENEHETTLLFKELLIGVTAFFRDEEAFAALEQALNDVLDAKSSGDMARIWVAGCSTGEEPYSIAILVKEYIERTGKALNVQIFATDLDENAINFARAGLYSDGIALDMSPERLERNFVREDHHYRIRKNVREMVIFATQNLVQDPPFTKLDMVSCRNLLIYLDASTQKKIIPLFHYSLRPGGLLFLGSSETVGAFGDIFTPLHVRWKIFVRREAPVPSLRLSRVPEHPRHLEAGPLAIGADKRMSDKTPSINELAQKLLLGQLVPPSVIINEKGDVFYIHGRTGLFLEPAQGQSQKTQNLFEMAREGLELPLITLVRRAAGADSEIVHKGVVVQGEAVPYLVRLRARKIDSPEALRGLIWVTFEKEDDQTQIDAADMPSAAESEALERELRYVKESLRNTIEELETSNEQIKSVNEELQSTNEELQSANEELETSKEEMQSLNEELQTVNEELENKVRDLAFANDDMKNLLNNTGIATLFLDNELRIKRFTVQAKKIINLIASDAGRPIGDIVTQLDYKNLVNDATEVLQTLVFREIEVRAHDWSWYLMRIMPYRTADNVIDGLAITFVDITRLKRSEILLAANIKALSMMSVEQAALKNVLDEIVLTIEHQTPDIWCSVSLVKDGKLNNISAPTLPEAFNDVLDGIEIRDESGEPCTEAAHYLKHVIISDLAGVQPPTDFSRLALSYDIKAAWSQPIFDNDKHLAGVFTIYYLRAHRPFDMEEALVNQAVPLMGLAISQSQRRTKE
jgi:two-component system CheB/CheR fusion protein